jgi:hypothetical protein
MKYVLAGLGLTGIILAAAFGCSSSSHMTDSDGTTVTNAADSAFVSSVFDAEMVLTSLESIDISRALMQTIEGAPPIAAPLNYEDGIVINAVTSYEYTNGWHIFQFEATVEQTMMADTITVTGWDSVKVVLDGYPVQVIDDITLADELYVRAHVNWVAASGTGSGGFHHRVGATRQLDGADTLITLSGSVVDSLHSGQDWGDSTGACVLDICLQENLTALQVDINAAEGECPRSGSVSMSAYLALDCEGDPQQGQESLELYGQWTMLAVINPDNTVTVTVTADNDTFTITESCGESVATVPPWGILP